LNDADPICLDAAHVRMEEAMTTARATLLAAVVFFAACNPDERRPGLWLDGDVAASNPQTWSFTEDTELVYVETGTWYGIPHSVTTTLVTEGGTLYVPSLYYGGGEFPEQRYWNRNVARDPDVRVGIGGDIYERRATLVTDPTERRRVLAAFAAKYDRWAEMLKDGDPAQPKIVLLRLDARTSA
jgi:F420H(2)-dependent quinone reductase